LPKFACAINDMYKRWSAWKECEGPVILLWNVDWEKPCRLLGCDVEVETWHDTPGLARDLRLEERVQGVEGSEGCAGRRILCPYHIRSAVNVCGRCLSMLGESVNAEHCVKCWNSSDGDGCDLVEMCHDVQVWKE
jgi:hypothetical protein